MIYVELLFWIALFIVFYTYIGYGIVLYLLVSIKEQFIKRSPLDTTAPLPEVTLCIAAYNEEEVIAEKMENCRQLLYPTKMHLVWVTDGSTDHTNDLLSAHSDVTLLYAPERLGKMAAINRAMTYIDTPIVVFTDANTLLNPEALLKLVEPFSNPQVGCVAGEKRISTSQKDNAATGGEGIYWQYESKLKQWDSLLHTTVGAAGELFAIRKELFTPLPTDTLLDDFTLSMQIAEKGYKIEYCADAYALENGSDRIEEEQKRKIRIAAGGIQAVWRLRHLLNPFKHPILTFQYFSHRVLRWTITPILFFLLLPLNLWITCTETGLFYLLFLILQLLFYGMAIVGARLANMKIKTKGCFIPYYFLFMNLNALKAIPYLLRHRGKGTWEKAKRTSI